MHRFLTFRRLGILFAGLFALSLVGIFIFQKFWVAPGERCEARGAWYDIESRTCATPIYIPDITGRPAGVTRAQASAEKNAELVVLERQVAEERAARQADTDAQSARLKAAQQ